MENVNSLVADGGKLFISIYNYQAGWSKIWKQIKKRYNRMPKILKSFFAFLVLMTREIKFFLITLLMLKPGRYIQYWTGYSQNRGMNRWHDLIDWVGGYPFEVAKPEEIFNFYQARGYVLEKMKTQGAGFGCNQFVFVKRS